MRWTALLLAASFLLPAAARAQEAVLEIEIGIGSCQGESSAQRQPGEVVTVVACVSSGESPQPNVALLFSEEGPSPSDRTDTSTALDGTSEVHFSSPDAGTSRFIVCGATACSRVVTVAWVLAGKISQRQDPTIPTVHFAGSGEAPVPPSDTEVPVAEEEQGFPCNRGPGSAGVKVPAFAAVHELERVRTRHPRTETATEAIKVTTAQHFVAGSVIYGSSAVAFLSLRDGQADVDDTGPFPLQGFNRVLAVWSTGEASFGKQELRYSGGSWRQAEPTFTAVIGPNGIEWFSDSAAFPSTTAAGARVGPNCSGVGFQELKVRSRAVPDPGEDETGTRPAVALFLLLVLGALTAGVLRASRPPSGGLVVEVPSGPMVRVERSDIRYDLHGRPTSYVEIVELPDGTTRTVRVRIGQESLVMDMSEWLDVTDWEDEHLQTRRRSMETDRAGRPESFIEETTAKDGTVSELKITHIVYDAGNRVVRYSRSSEGSRDLGGTQVRSEIVSLEHEGLAIGSRSPVLAEVEDMIRTDMHLDDEGHVKSYVAAVHTDGSGKLEEDVDEAVFLPGVPRVMFELGQSFAAAPAFVSKPNKGLIRLRNVLTSWFREHGCKVQLRVRDSSGHPMSGARFFFGSARAALDSTGNKTIWVMSPGNYAVGLLDMDDDPSGGHDLGQRSGSDLLGWIVVQNIPGWVEADFTQDSATRHLPQG